MSPPIAPKTPSSSRELTMVVIDRHSDRLSSMLRKKSSRKKRKAGSCFTSPLSQEEIEVELMDADKHTLSEESEEGGLVEFGTGGCSC